MIISCLGIIVYSNTLNSPFYLDDLNFIVKNPYINNFQNLFNIWRCYPCRFVTFLSIALSYHFNGLNVLGYHLFNITIHLASAILVWWLVLLTLRTPVMKDDKITKHANLIAFFAGLIFVSHPVQTEAVTYIWQRAASMAALFYLASLCFYIKSRLLVLTGEHKACSYYILSLIMAVLAMFSKENSITLPLIILLYEFSFFEFKKIPHSKYFLPFLLTLFIIPSMMLLSKMEQFQEFKILADWKENPPLHYFLTQFRVIVTYIRLLFLPFNQNFDYDYHISTSFFEWPTLISFLFLTSILFGAKQLFVKYRLIAFSIFWFFLTLSVESSFFPLSKVIYEHRLYLPLVGYSIFLIRPPQ